MSSDIFISKFLEIFSDNTQLWYEWLDLTISKGSLHTIDDNEDEILNVYDYYNESVGFRCITNEKKDPLAFYPIFDFPESCKGVINSLSEFENKINALRAIDIQNVMITTFAVDQIFHNSSKLIASNIPISLIGYAYSLERQIDPPSVKQSDGSLVTTKGSSIFYNAKGKSPSDYIYQLNVESIEKFIWNDYMTFYQVRTTLFKLPNLIVPYYLYVSERVIQQHDYAPRIGDDVMGIMSIFSKLY